MAATTDKTARTLDLITKLLAKAEATQYPEEARAFQEHAERLMVRYGIEKAAVDAEAGKLGKPREKMVEKRYTVDGVYRLGRLAGLVAVARAFNSVEILKSSGKLTKTIYLIGAESDVDQIIRLFDSLLVQVETAMTSWWLTVEYRAGLTDAEKRRERRQFQLGYFARVAHRLAAIYGEESTGQELVLSGRKDRALEYSRELHPKLAPARRTRILGGSTAARNAGIAAGATADVSPGRKVSADEKEEINV